MSECVVRMEIPNGCHDCKLRNMVGNCPIPMFGGQDEEKIWTLTECFRRPPWCPIICSLPEGHGRLIDADKEIDFQVNDFERVKTEGIDVYSKAYSLSDLCDGITYAYDHANIIVPTERKEV